MHVIVVGCGRVGSGLASSLEKAGHTVAIIDKSNKSFRRLGSDVSATRINGLGFDREVIEAAGGNSASAFAAVTSGDNSNILAARIAKENFEIPHVVARIYDPRRAQIYQRLGIATVATVAWTTDQIARRLVPNSSADWTDQSGNLSLVEHSLPIAWAGQNLSGLNDGDRCRLAAISRGGSAQLPTGDVIGQEGDVLHLLVRSDAAAALAARLASGPQH